MTAHILQAYRGAARGRRYIAGAAGIHPLRLSARDITDWLEAHPLPLPRRYIDQAMFALDEVELAKDSDED